MSKCLLFDCDGTLVDSEYLNSEAMSAELALSGIVEEPGSLFRRYKGGNFLKVLQDLEQRHGVSIDDQFSERFRVRAQQVFTNQLKPVPGIHEALRLLHQHKCVVSNAPIAKITHELTLTDLESFFGNRLYSAYEVGNWKPDPELFLHAAKAEGFSPADCIVIEDSTVGVQAALSAGMPVVLYDQSNSPDAEAHPTVTIDNMSKLPEAISRL